MPIKRPQSQDEPSRLLDILLPPAQLKCSHVKADGQTCNNFLSLAAQEHGSTKCRAHRPKHCKYRYANGKVCGETNLAYHGHCHLPSCGGVLCELCEVCPQCVGCSH